MRYIILLLATSILYSGSGLTLKVVEKNPDNQSLVIQKKRKTIKTYQFKTMHLSIVKNNTQKNRLVIIAERYQFHILSLKTLKLSGPFAPKFNGMGADSQSGMLTKMFLHHNFFGGRSVDSGPFLFQIKNINKPVEITSTTTTVGHYLILQHKKQRQIIDTIHNRAMNDHLSQSIKDIEKLKIYLKKKLLLGDSIRSYNLYSHNKKAYQEWRTIEKEWRKNTLSSCIKKYTIKLSCSGRKGSCERVILHTIFDIDQNGDVQGVDVVKRSLCKHPNAVQKCLLKPFLKKKFPKPLRKMRLYTILGAALKC